MLRTLDYVKAAGCSVNGPGKIVYRHLVRNVVGTVVVQSTFEVANAILLFAALSFLGLGPPPPAANWGGMLTSAWTMSSTATGGRFIPPACAS